MVTSRAAVPLNSFNRTSRAAVSLMISAALCERFLSLLTCVRGFRTPRLHYALTGLLGSNAQRRPPRIANHERTGARALHRVAGELDVVRQDANRLGVRK